MFPRSLAFIQIRFLRSSLRNRVPPVVVAKVSPVQNVEQTSYQWDTWGEEEFGSSKKSKHPTKSPKHSDEAFRPKNSDEAFTPKYSDEAFTPKDSDEAFRPKYSDEAFKPKDIDCLQRKEKIHEDERQAPHIKKAKKSKPLTFLRLKDFSDKSNMPNTNVISKFHKQELLDFPNLMEFSLLHSEEGILTAENQFKRLSDHVLPLWRIPYGKQLALKQRHMKRILEHLTEVMGSHYKQCSEDVRNSFRRSMERFELAGLKYSDMTTKFRNTSEFSVNTGIDGNPDTVGFYVGKPALSNVICVPVDHLLNLKKSHRLVAEHFQNFIRSMPYTACLNYESGGVWKNILVRSTEDGQLMIVAIINPRELNEEEVENIGQQFKNYFLTGPGQECGATSILLQCSLNTRSSHEDAPFIILHGPPHIIETINDQSFIIKPDSFFQSNTLAAAILFDAVKDLVGMNPHATVLDACCGTGALGLQVAPNVRSVIGVDIIKNSIEDAKVNAAKNNLKNCLFFHGKLETLLPSLLRDFSHLSEVIAIVNPPKNGLSPNTINELKMCPTVRKIIYVSCRPAFAFNDFAMICQVKPPRNKKEKMPPPFVPTYAIPVDMFPHTPYVELVIAFERSGSKYVDN